MASINEVLPAFVTLIVVLCIVIFVGLVHLRVRFGMRRARRFQVRRRTDFGAEEGITDDMPAEPHSFAVISPPPPAYGTTEAPAHLGGPIDAATDANASFRQASSLLQSSSETESTTTSGGEDEEREDVWPPPGPPPPEYRRHDQDGPPRYEFFDSRFPRREHSNDHDVYQGDGRDGRTGGGDAEHENRRDDEELGEEDSSDEQTEEEEDSWSEMAEWGTEATVEGFDRMTHRERLGEALWMGRLVSSPAASSSWDSRGSRE